MSLTITNAVNNNLFNLCLFAIQKQLSRRFKILASDFSISF